MDWNQLLLLIIGTILTGLFGWLTTVITSWLNAKIKDEKLKKFVLSINDIVVKNVKYVYQTYVEELKAQGTFNKEAQAIALNKCKDLCLTEFSEDMKTYLMINYSDIVAWTLDKIETTIYDLKGAKK